MKWPPHYVCETDLGELHRAIIEQAQDAIIFADRLGVIRLWNRGAEIIFGYGAAEAVGRDLDLIVPRALRAAHHEGWRRTIETGAVRHDGRVLTTRAQHKYGSQLYVELSFNLLKDETGRITGAFAIGRDCTARELEQQAARQLMAESLLG